MILTVDEAVQLREGQRLVFTNGVFDLLHAGHVRYLAEAKSHGDILVVGINSDDSVRRLGKGPERPINTVEDRAAVLAALKAVDGVVVFEEDNPIRLIETLQPEIHVKGGDYDADTLPETETVRSYGGEIIIIPLLPGRSTTSILKRLG